MASSHSIGGVNIQINANAERLIQAMKAADASVRGAVTKMDAEMGRLQRSLGRKFSVSDIGKDIVKGLGIGSGFALAQQAADLLVSHWRAAAEEAKAVERSTARQLEIVQKIIAARQTPGQQADTAWKTERNAMRDFQDTQMKAAASWSNMLGGFMGGSLLGAGLDKLLGTPNQADVQAALANWQEEYGRFLQARKNADAAESKVAEQNIQQSLAQVDRLNKQLGQINIDIAKEAELRIAAYWDEDAALQKKADALLDTLDPMREYRRELELIAQLEARRKLTPEEAQKLKDQKFERFAAPLNDLSTQAIEGGAADTGDQLDEAARKASKVAEMGDRIGYAFTSGFEDAIFEGKKLSDVLDQLGQDIMRIAFRTMVSEPLGQMLGHMVAGGIGKIFGGFFAEGGTPPMGKVSVVGESGPELFVPHSAGTIVPNHQLGGNTITNHYVIDARGADESAVVKLERALVALAGPGVVERRAVLATRESALRAAY